MTTAPLLLSGPQAREPRHETTKVARTSFWTRATALLRARPALDPKVEGAELELRCLDASAW